MPESTAVDTVEITTADGTTRVVNASDVERHRAKRGAKASRQKATPSSRSNPVEVATKSEK